jgi:hypothetical protein
MISVNTNTMKPFALKVAHFVEQLVCTTARASVKIRHTFVDGVENRLTTDIRTTAILKTDTQKIRILIWRKNRINRLEH